MYKYWCIIVITQFSLIMFSQCNTTPNQDVASLIRFNVPDVNKIQTCNNDPETILFNSETEGEEIKKIRSYYAHIEKNKNTYKAYRLFKSEKDEYYLINKDDERIEEEGGQFIIELKNSYLIDYGQSLYFFDKEEALVYIEQNSWDYMAVSSGGETLVKYYFVPGSIHPFFIYAYEYTYSTFFDYDVINTETFLEHRIYVEQDSAIDGECPKIIRALIKNHEAKRIIANEDYTGNFDSGSLLETFNKKPNKKMTSTELFSIAKKLLLENDIISLAKTKKISSE